MAEGRPDRWANLDAPQRRRPGDRGAFRGQAQRGRERYQRPFGNRGGLQANQRRENPRSPSAHSSNATSARHDVQPIPYMRLKEMYEDDTIEANHIIMQLSCDQSGFAHRLRGDIDGGMIQMLLKVISKMCRGENLAPSFNQVLTTILKSNFTDKVVRFLHQLIRENVSRRENAPTHVSNALDLLKAWLEVIPTTSENEASILLTHIKHVFVKLNIGSKLDIASRVEDIDDVISELESRHAVKPENSNNNEESPLHNMHSEQPPNDFRTISVFPQRTDINQTSQPYVRTNLVNNAYTDAAHYLDVQFRLLREDFVRPLREGIQYCFTAGGETHLRKKDQQNIKVYEDVRIEYPTPGRTGIQYCVHFNPSKLQGVKWETSRRLMYGNLVCLSSDKFKNNFLFATIADRDPRQLQMGYVVIEFVCNDGVVGPQVRQNLRDIIRQERRENLRDFDYDSTEEDSSDEEEENPNENLVETTGNSLVTLNDMKKRYFMVETEAYFKSYQHVLSGLQKLQTIPLSRYIVECNPTMRPPVYIRASAKPQYDLTRAMRKDEGGGVSGNSIVNLLNNLEWPSSFDLQLDPSQLAGLKSALTNELSVIQGPPGTGKTHVGLIIMNLLLSNASLRAPADVAAVAERTRTGVNPSQILVVCYTNHALDQFLEGVQQFQKMGIIRVGGRCRSKTLEKLTLNSVRRGRLTTSTGKFHRRTVYNIRSDLDKQRSFISSHTDVLDVSTHSIVGLNKLNQVIPYHKLNQLTDGSFKGNDSLLRWLGIVDSDEGLYKKTYIVNETIKAAARPFLQRNYQFSQVLAAVNAMEHLEVHILQDWIMRNPYIYENDIESINPDIVFAFLDEFPIPPHFQPLLDEGFHQIEIKCALYVTGFMRPDVTFIRNWLQQHSDQIVKKNTEEAEELITEPPTDEFSSLEIKDDDILFLEEQRNVDPDDEEEYLVKKDAAQRRRNAEATKKIERELAAATFDQIKSGGWQLQPEERKRRKQMVKDEIGRGDAMRRGEADRVVDIFALNQNDRWRLYRRWVQDLRHELRSIISVASVEYNRLAKLLEDARNEEDFQILRSAEVVGMTTTGAAMYRDIVQRLPAKVVVVEEAAEVLEAHIVTSLPAATQHLILIGDHQQLRPSPAVYDLAKKYNLDVSLFERMINNGIPHSKLELQHRMRPRIADLIRPYIYENLRDHNSVLAYDNIMGVQKNIFFITHDQEEDSVADGKSKINRHEAMFLVAFSQYLLQQGYLPEQITILTTYVGQLHVINRLLPRNAGRVRVTVVDNYQGEENDIVLLSLVRSNEEGKIGFLSIENRVCVALSRAKKGLFCIGNATLLKEKSALWRSILDGLERDGMFGRGLGLQCQNHPEDTVTVSYAKDFEKVPEGGCGKKCTARLPCGHACNRSCHPDDSQHLLFKCRKACEKKCANDHKCTLFCWQPCKCLVKMEKTIPRCGHVQKMACSMKPSNFTCRVPCTDVKPCGHVCSGTCGEPCPTNCKVQVEVSPACGHPVIKVACCDSNKLTKDLCRHPCQTVLKCGHRCSGNCYKCEQGRLHVRCQEKCERVLFCGHLCQENCSAKCPPCNRQCETRCAHSECPKKCFETCILCKEKCVARFDGNVKCDKLCCEPCAHLPSNQPCEKKLKCGHECIGLAEEECPKLCRVCHKETVTEIFFGNEEDDDARFVQLECGHLFTYADLDKWMEQESAENTDNISIQLKECPRCKRVIRRSNRYRSIINKQLMLINEVKEKINGKAIDIQLAKSDLIRSITRGRLDDDLNYLKLQSKIGKAKTLNDLVVLEVQFLNIRKLEKIKKQLSEMTKKPASSSIYQFRTEILRSVKKLQTWIFHERAYFSDQEIADLEGELKRLQLCLQYIELFNKRLSSIGLYLDTRVRSELKSKMSQLQAYLFDDLRRYDEVDTQVEKLMEEIKELVSGGDLLAQTEI